MREEIIFIREEGETLVYYHPNYIDEPIITNELWITYAARKTAPDDRRTLSDL